MSFLNRIASLSIAPFSGPDSPETQPVRMSLEERMALRREMAFAVVRDVIGAWGLPEASYRFRVVPVDRRGHTYVAMIDLPVQFMTTEKISQRELLRLGAMIDAAAIKRFNLQVLGVYWRINEALSIDLSDQAGTRQKMPDDGPQTRGTAVPEPSEAASLAAIERSLARGAAAHVDGRVYDTDLSPLAHPHSSPSQH